MRKNNILLLMLLIFSLVLIKIAHAAPITSEPVSIKVSVGECGEDEIISKGKCAPCADGWKKVSDTKCEFNGDNCIGGTEWNGEFCEQKEIPNVKCKEGYEPVKKPLQKEINGSLIVNKENIECVSIVDEQKSFIKRLVIGGIGILALFVFIWFISNDIKGWKKKKTEIVEDAGEEEIEVDEDDENK